MVGLTGRQCMSLSGRESLRPLVGLVLTPPLDVSEWMEANLTCMCVRPSFHSSALLGMSSTPLRIRVLKINQALWREKQRAGPGHIRESFQALKAPHTSGPARSASRQDPLNYNPSPSTTIPPFVWYSNKTLPWQIKAELRSDISHTRKPVTV